MLRPPRAPRSQSIPAKVACPGPAAVRVRVRGPQTPRRRHGDHRPTTADDVDGTRRVTVVVVLRRRRLSSEHHCRRTTLVGRTRDSGAILLYFLGLPESPAAVRRRRLLFLTHSRPCARARIRAGRPCRLFFASSSHPPPFYYHVARCLAWSPRSTDYNGVRAFRGKTTPPPHCYTYITLCGMCTPPPTHQCTCVRHLSVGRHHHLISSCIFFCPSQLSSLWSLFFARVRE